ncbi:MAG: ABC transporter ATP-binding protein [Defluviitaleaceae bacterium]|nr:ABC transporter ATP-binding protein [Defluviitaleaceae bacterium]
MTTYAVETQGLTKRYKTALAVDNIDLAVPAGCCCGFLGKNGAGKTTTIKMLVGLKRPTAGTISIMGQQQKFGVQNQLPFGYLPDVPNFYGYMNGTEFLDLSARLCGIPTAQRKDRVRYLLKQVGLDRTRTRISGYSRGMKQRLGIAQAMINNPPVIFMDEPVSALDPIGRRDVVEIIQSLKGTTVVFSTHILADVENLCDYVLIIDNGKILAADYMANLKERHSKNTAKIRFYQPQDAKTFTDCANTELFTVEQQPNPMELILHSQAANMQELSHAVTAILQSHNLPMENFGAHTPHLEDIFYETIGK